MRNSYELGMEREFKFVLKLVGYELDKWVQRKGSNQNIVAECANITPARLDLILEGEANDVTLKEISDIAYHLGLELKASIRKE